jgi:hypothetical protein
MRADNERFVIDGWEEIERWLESDRSSHWMQALDEAEHLFRTMLMTKTNADSVREGLAISLADFSDAKTLLEAREVYRELKTGETSDELDKATASDLVNIYRQAIEDLVSPRVDKVENRFNLWLVIAGIIIIALVALIFTGAGESLLRMMQSAFSFVFVIIAVVIGLGLTVLLTFLYLDFRTKRNNRS